MSKRSLNLNRAVSNHPANQGLVGWWLSLPGMVGGPKYWDITQFRNHAVSTYNNPHVAIEKRFGRVKPFGGWSKGFYANGLTNFPDIDLSSPFTFTCVIISISSGSGGVVEFYNNASPQTGIGVDSYGVIKTYVAGPGGTILLNTGSDGWRNPGIYHVVYTQDQTYSYVYVNGKYFTSADSSGSRKTGAIRNLCLVGDPLAFLSTSSSVGDVRLSRGWVSSSTVGFLYSQYRRDYPDLLAYRSWVSFAKTSPGGTTITASISQGSVSLTAESLPLVSLTASASIAQGSVALTAQTLPSVGKTVTASISQGSVSLTAESLPLVSLTASASIAQGSVALTAQTLPLVSRSANAAIAQGSVSLTAETLPAVTLSASASIAQGSVSLAPQTVTATIVPASPPPPPGTITASIIQGSVSLSGQQVTTVATFGASINQGSVGLSAQTVTPAAAFGAAISTGYTTSLSPWQTTTTITATVVTSFILGTWTNNGGVGDTFVRGFPGTLTVQGRTFQVGDTVLVNRSTNLANGLYVCAADGTGAQTVTFVRDSRMVSAAAIQTTLVIASSFDTTNGGTAWVNSVLGPITFGTTPLAFAQTGQLSFAYVPSNNIAINPGSVTLTAFPITVQITSSAITVPFDIVASENIWTVAAANSDRWSVEVVDSVATITMHECAATISLIEYVDIVRFN